MTCLLALDLGSHTGWALGPVQSITPPLYGRWNLSGDHGPRFIQLREHISAQLSPLQSEKGLPVVIAYEEVRRWSSSSAAHLYCGFRSVIHILAAEGSHQILPLSPSAIKQHATGSGNATKVQMIQAAVKRLSVPLDHQKKGHDDMADALWTFDLARCRLRDAESTDATRSAETSEHPS